MYYYFYKVLFTILQLLTSLSILKFVIQSLFSPSSEGTLLKDRQWRKCLFFCSHNRYIDFIYSNNRAHTVNLSRALSAHDNNSPSLQQVNKNLICRLKSDKITSGEKRDLNAIKKKMKRLRSFSFNNT